MKRVRYLRRFSRAIEVLEDRCVLSGAPYISEFMASNDGVFLDGDGNDSDWIEIHNPTDSLVNLTGWHLTDSRTNLDKWTFPSHPQSILHPGEYRIVFASGQSNEAYVDPAGYLHTDFRLSASGEYLALTNLFEDIVFEYAAAYPPQLTDVSYGIAQERVTHVGQSSMVSAIVPTDGSLDANSPIWAQVDFDASSWPSAMGTGVGYDTASGPTEGPPNGTEINSLVGNDLTDPEQDGLLNVIIDAGLAGTSPANEQPRHGLDSTTETKWLSFSPEGTYFEMEFTDGIPRIVDSYTISSANDASDRDPYSWTLSGSSDGDSFSVIDTRTAQNFADRFETRLYEFINTTPYTHYRFDFETEYGVTGQNQPVAIQMAEIELLASEAQGYFSLIDLDINDAWNATRSSLYQRIEFDVADPGAIGSLSLDMQYDDGFVAYLNG
ncbi:MAG: lamin tail domain-containing protein, partial [Planctomycetota bacterium]